MERSIPTNEVIKAVPIPLNSNWMLFWIFCVDELSKSLMPNVNPRKVPKRPNPTKVPAAVSNSLRFILWALQVLNSEKISSAGVLVCFLSVMSMQIVSAYDSAIEAIFVSFNAFRVSSLFVAFSSSLYKRRTLYACHTNMPNTISIITTDTLGMLIYSLMPIL